MSTLRISVPKPPVGSGTPTPKEGKVKVIYVADVLSEPARDANGVKMIGNYILKPGYRMIEVYMTPKTQKGNATVEGDRDYSGFKHAFEGSAPMSMEMREWVAKSIDEGFIIIYGAGCGAYENYVLGSKCSPVFLKPDFSDDDTASKINLKFEQDSPQKLAPGFYQGSYSFAENYTATTPDLALLQANGFVYQLPSAAITDDITAASIDLESGTVISLVGGGGVAPFTLSEGIQGAVTVLLKDGTDWTAVKDAVINLQVLDAGTIIYLIEQSRT